MTFLLSLAGIYKAAGAISRGLAAAVALAVALAGRYAAEAIASGVLIAAVVAVYFEPTPALRYDALGVFAALFVAGVLIGRKYA